MNPHTQEHHAAIKRRAEEAARIERLPRWAQQKIITLQANLDSANAKVRAMANLAEGIVGTETMYLDGMTEIPLPPRSHIRIMLTPGVGAATKERRWIDVRYTGAGTNQHRADVVQVHGSARLTVRPESSNSFTVDVER